MENIPSQLVCISHMLKSLQKVEGRKGEGEEEWLHGHYSRMFLCHFCCSWVWFTDHNLFLGGVETGITHAQDSVKEKENFKCFVKPLKRSFKKSWGQYFWVKISWKLVQWPLAFSFPSPPTQYSFHLKRYFDQSHISESFMWKTWSPNEVLLLKYDFSKCSHSLQFFRVSKKQEVLIFFTTRCTLMWWENARIYELSFVSFWKVFVLAGSLFMF